MHGPSESSATWGTGSSDWSNWWLACFDLSGKELWHHDFAKSQVSALEFDATGANVTAYITSSWQTFSVANGQWVMGGSVAASITSGKTVPAGNFLVTIGTQTSGRWLSIHDRSGAKLWQATSVPKSLTLVGLAADGTLYVSDGGWILYVYETGVRDPQQ